MERKCPNKCDIAHARYESECSKAHFCLARHLNTILSHAHYHAHYLVEYSICIYILAQDVLEY